MQKILLVDDNQNNRYYLEVMLKTAGYAVDSAENGAQALELAEVDRPDLIISDLLMPIMDGFSLCREWKSNPRLVDIPFIVYTATYTEREDEELALGFGADRFIRKPQDPEALLEIIRETLAILEDAPAETDATVSESDLLLRYNQALFHKLERKMAALEARNAELERTISERDRAAEALTESEAKYRIVADNTSNWEFWTNPEGLFEFISPSCERITGYSRDEFLRDPELMNRIVHPEDAARVLTHRSHEERAGRDTPIEYRILHADGSIRWLCHDCLPIFDKSRSWIGTRGSNRDITERMRLQEQLIHSQKLEAVGRLAGGIAHDFNNILTAILGYVDILRTAETDPAERSEYLDEIAASVERAANLTQSLLTFSRKQEMAFCPFDLNHLVRNSARLIRQIIGADMQVITKLSDTPVVIHGDTGQIEQILMNLAANARDAMPEGGSLNIETDLLEIDHSDGVPGTGGTPGRYAMLSISDTGVGMDEKTRNMVFEPFFTTKEYGKGTGLGLSIVYGIVNQHGGRIDVHSEPGTGTTFRMIFRAGDLEDECTPADTGRSVSSESTGTETILLADDDKAVRTMLGLYLTSRGYTVLDASNGAEALELFGKNPYSIDLVVLDAIMPKKTGRDAAMEIRAIRPGQPIIIMSGYPSNTLLEELRNNDIEFARKLLRPAELAEKVRRILDTAMAAGGSR